MRGRGLAAAARQRAACLSVTAAYHRLPQPQASDAIREIRAAYIEILGRFMSVNQVLSLRGAAVTCRVAPRDGCSSLHIARYQSFPSIFRL